jgi:hypothetical protein
MEECAECQKPSPQEDCAKLQKDEEKACNDCECYRCCWGEYPWEAANAAYYSSRGC